MSAGIDLPTLRAGVSRALNALLMEVSHEELGRQCGVVGTTVSRRGAEVCQWPASDLLLLAMRHRDLADAIRSYLDGKAPRTGDAVDTVPALFDEIKASADLTFQAADYARDGRVTPVEARSLLRLIECRRKIEEERLMPDLHALTQQVRQ